MKEGMFRIPGRMTEILEMKISFEQGKNLCKPLHYNSLIFYIISY